MKVNKNHIKRVLKILGITALAIFCYILAHKAATVERGYEALGGELFIPFLVLFGGDIWEIIKAPFKGVQGDNVD